MAELPQLLFQLRGKIFVILDQKQLQRQGAVYRYDFAAPPYDGQVSYR